MKGKTNTLPSFANCKLASLAHEKCISVALNRAKDSIACSFSEKNRIHELPGCAFCYVKTDESTQENSQSILLSLCTLWLSVV